MSWKRKHPVCLCVGFVSKLLLTSPRKSRHRIFFHSFPCEDVIISTVRLSHDIDYFTIHSKSLFTISFTSTHIFSYISYNLKQQNSLIFLFSPCAGKKIINSKPAKLIFLSPSFLFILLLHINVSHTPWLWLASVI